MRVKTLLLITALPAFAQLPSSPPALPLSLKQAVQIALAPEGSARVQLAREAVEQAAGRSAESRAALLPDLEGYLTEENQTRNLRAFGIQFPDIPGFRFPTVVGPFGTFDVRAQATQSVFDFSAIRRFQAAKIAIEAARADASGTRDQVTGEVARAYLAGLRAHASVETAQANLELSQALLDLARSQKTAGTGTGIEVTRAQVQMANDRQRLLVAQNEADRAHLQLLKLIGVKLENPVELTDKLAFLPLAPVAPEEAVALARRNRSELRAQESRERNASLSYSATKYERLPTLGAFADYGTIGTSPTNALPTRAYGVTLRVPVFDGGRRDARRGESASLLREQRIRTADLRDQIELDVRVSLDSLRSAAAQVTAAEEGLGLAENELAQARRRYQAGVASGIEVTDAQTRLDRARDNRIAALYNHNLARIDFGAATGTIQTLLQ